MCFGLSRLHAPSLSCWHSGSSVPSFLLSISTELKYTWSKTFSLCEIVECTQSWKFSISGQSKQACTRVSTTKPTTEAVGYCTNCSKYTTPETWYTKHSTASTCGATILPTLSPTPRLSCFFWLLTVCGGKGFIAWRMSTSTPHSWKNDPEAYFAVLYLNTGEYLRSKTLAACCSGQRTCVWNLSFQLGPPSVYLGRHWDHSHDKCSLPTLLPPFFNTQYTLVPTYPLQILFNGRQP